MVPELRPSGRKTRTVAPREPAADEERAYLLLLVGDSSSVLPLPRDGAVLVGRAPEADVVLDDDAVSRRHARILSADGLVTVTDLDSYNGTEVNGERIRGARTLFFGDTIAIGQALLVLH